MNLNNKGYMLVEIIVAFTIAMAMLYFLANIVVNIKNISDDYYVEAKLEADQLLMTNVVMKDIVSKDLINVDASESNIVKFEFSDGTKTRITIVKDNKKTYFKYGVWVDNDYDLSTLFVKEIDKRLKIGNTEISNECFDDNGVMACSTDDENKNIKANLIISLPIMSIYSDNNYGIYLSIPHSYGTIKIISSCSYNLFASEYVKCLSKGDSWESNASGVYATNSYDDNGVTKYHEYRYIGANVDNWVKFNDDMYRIIGAFDANSHGQTGQNLVKLISARSIGSFSWGLTNGGYDYASFSSQTNNWSVANANILLNEYFLNKLGISNTYGLCSYWSYYSNSDDYRTNDCNTIIVYGISNDLRSYIQPVTWYLKGMRNGNFNTKTFYDCERNQGKYKDYSYYCNNNYTKEVVEKSVGLMYVSDYLYASGNYTSDSINDDSSSYYANSKERGKLNWLFNGEEWTIGVDASNTTNAFYINGGIGSTGTLNSKSIRPAFYLKSSVKIKSGKGTFDNPYIIGT